MVLYPDIKHALDQTVVPDYPIQNVEVTDLLKGLAALPRKPGDFDFGTVRIDPTNIAPEKMLIRGPYGFNHATGLQVLRFIAASIGGRYDIDDTGVFIYGEPKPAANVPAKPASP
jgi:hypothetical protein